MSGVSTVPLIIVLCIGALIASYYIHRIYQNKKNNYVSKNEIRRMSSRKSNLIDSEKFSDIVEIDDNNVN